MNKTSICRNDNPLISIITIVYNEEDAIEQTILSVIGQSFTDFEYIVVDGGSTDGTNKVIAKYKDKIDFYCSEQDKGIYDAMNKGIYFTRGKWVNFMNAGDTFHSFNVLSNVFSQKLNFDKLSLIYGYKFVEGVPIKPFELSILKKGILMGNHQSMFFNKGVLGEQLMYNLNYPIYADYELVNRIFIKYKKESFKYLNLPVATYKGGGVSSVVSSQKRLDKFKIVFHSYGLYGLINALFFSKFSLKKQRWL
jgi:putative colanic acid biosynthesis glycosyltransferase